jgi:hypothetical protein
MERQVLRVAIAVVLRGDETSTPLENADVAFVPRTALTPFIPQE